VELSDKAASNYKMAENESVVLETSLTTCHVGEPPANSAAHLLLFSGRGLFFLVCSFRQVAEKYVMHASDITMKSPGDPNEGAQWRSGDEEYKHDNSATLAAYSNTADILMDNNKFAMAAKICKKMGAINEKEHNTAEAIKSYGMAANWSANKQISRDAHLTALVSCSLLLLLPYVSFVSHMSEHAKSFAKRNYVDNAFVDAEDSKRAIIKPQTPDVGIQRMKQEMMRNKIKQANENGDSQEAMRILEMVIQTSNESNDPDVKNIIKEAATKVRQQASTHTSTTARRSFLDR
jgi:hypothetical protein